MANHFLSIITAASDNTDSGFTTYRKVGQVLFDLLLTTGQEVVDESLHDASEDFQLLRSGGDAGDLALVTRV